MPGEVRHGQDQLILEKARERNRLVAHLQRLVIRLQAGSLRIVAHDGEAYVAIDVDLHRLEAALADHREPRPHATAHPGPTALVALEAERELRRAGRSREHLREPGHPIDRHAPGQRLAGGGESKRLNMLRQGLRHKRRIVMTAGARCQSPGSGVLRVGCLG